ncbi:MULTISPECIES: endolytic transglycosylase MltG [unclassified Microbacterium]|uniref:endolytic transglycosylase MltG n=1 Tax=unclassified Microbacterium TaxID=2609290 RepID=UPI00214B0447|nr:MULTISPECIES: endolytic transglycosylase MltG [unclassified Microbacterium]MCR2785677.1 endolytic transglycosylase MltG [Microbacterium sp. zg.B96]WIM17338.1 endolytic transglycosylase MltG [Microbacterium sp. zg-B96]
MPSPSTPFDDPFADLFGKLPDPRHRIGAARATESPAAGGPTAGPTADDRVAEPPVADGASGSAPATGSDATTGANTTLGSAISRRAARAATRDTTAVAPVPAESPESTPAPVPAAASVPATDAPSASAAVTASGDPAPLRAAPRPAATATLDALFTGEVSTNEVGAPPPPPNKRRRRIGGWVALGIVLLLLGGIAAGGLWVWNTYEEPIRELMGWEEPKDYLAGEATGEATVAIISGDTGEPISQKLFEAGVTKTPDAFYDHLIETGQNPEFQPGVFQLQQRMTSAAALEALLDPANKLSDTAQLREGLTVEDSLQALADGLQLPIEDFQAAVANPADYGVPGDSLEGWLFPATYTFDPGVTAPDVIRTLVDRTVQSLDNAGVPVERRHEILTIASIIEREARFEDDFYKVSRVIQNRLSPDNTETSGLLQMDSTAQYGFNEMHDGTVSSSQEALEDDNPWNTYVHPGLPVGPIANPGDLAIDAAMHPADGPWMYFVTVNLDTGETVFTNTGAEHEAAVKQWQQWCADHPDSGC